MGNRLSLSFVFLSFFISILFTSFGWAKITEVKCPINDMSSITYLGTNLSGTIKTCLKDVKSPQEDPNQIGGLISDDQAQVNCKSQFLNYYSTDYAVNGSRTSSRGVSVDDNTQGTLYVCFTGGKIKKSICETKAAENNKKAGKTVMKWDVDGKHGNGHCNCIKTAGGPFENCDDPVDQTAVVPTESCDKIANSTPNKDENGKVVSCRCNDNATEGPILEIPPANPNNQKCPSSNTAATGKVTEAFKKCIDDEVDASKQCVDLAKTAQVKCDIESKDADNENAEKKAATKNVSDTNKFLQMGAGAVGVLGKAMIQKSAGTGAISDCMMTGAAANAAKSALLGLQEECNTKFSECTNACSGDKAQEVWNKCSKYIDDKNVDLSAPADRQAIDQNYYNEKLASDINPNYETGKQTCTDKVASADAKPSDKSAKANKNYFDTFMRDMASTMQNSAVCACNFSAAAASTGGASGCNSVPTQEQCIASNYTLAGCASYGIMDVCTVGSTSYNASACACKMGTSNDPSCKTVATAGAASGFAGSPLTNSTGSGGTSFGAGGGTGVNGNFADGNMNLSGQKADDLAAGLKNNKELSGFANGAGSGGGGGGVSAPPGSGGAGGVNENAAVEGDGKSTSGGLFGQAKSFIGSMFGGNKNNNGNGTGVIPGRGTPGIDLERFRPPGLRGLAGSSGIGGKNMDIWKMMNSRYEANSITFIQTP